MTVQISIIGLGQIGASVGLGLQKFPGQFTRVGHDKDSGVTSKAKRLGAVDKIHVNLLNSVKDADIILLALPMDEVQDVLKLIARDLKEGVVILDTAPIRQEPMAWAQEFLPKGRFYVGFTPMVGPMALHKPYGGVDGASAELFDKGLVAITAPSGTAEGAIKLATDLTEMLGATPLFADVMEIDSLMAATHILPQLISAALSNVTVSRPGWQEGRKFAGRPYAQASGAIGTLDTPSALALIAQLNKENLVRVINDLIAELVEVREEVSAEKMQDLQKRLETALKGREQWLQERGLANWSGEELPELDYDKARPNLFGRMFSDKVEGEDEG